MREEIVSTVLDLKSGGNFYTLSNIKTDRETFIDIKILIDGGMVKERDIQKLKQWHKASINFAMQQSSGKESPLRKVKTPRYGDNSRPVSSIKAESEWHNKLRGSSLRSASSFSMASSLSPSRAKGTTSRASIGEASSIKVFTPRKKIVAKEKFSKYSIP